MPCDPGQICDDFQLDNASVCFNLGGANDECDPLHFAMPCSAGYSCDDLESPPRCKPTASGGQSCTSSATCKAGYACSSTSHTCVVAASAGQPCTSYEDCASGLYCDLAASSGNATCLPSAAPGQPCHEAIGACTSGKACEFAAGSACKINHDCKDSGGACCATAGGSACAAYSASCKTASGTCP
jgi:hypothetical protein